MAVKTFVTNEVLTASDTNTYLNNGGLVSVLPTTVTNGTVTSGQATIRCSGSATSITINGIFTSTFEDYFVVARMTSASGDIFCQLTNAGTPVTTNTYNWSMMQAYAGAGVSTVRTANTSSMTWFAMGAGTTAACASYVDVCSPYLAEPTLFTVQNNRSDGNYQTPANYLFYGNNANATSYDGIKLSATGNIAGRIMVYGRRV